MHAYLEQRAVDNGHITAERLQGELESVAENIRQSVLKGVSELIAEKLQELRVKTDGEQEQHDSPRSWLPAWPCCKSRLAK